MEAHALETLRRVYELEARPTEEKVQKSTWRLVFDRTLLLPTTDLARKAALGLDLGLASAIVRERNGSIPPGRRLSLLQSLAHGPMHVSSSRGTCGEHDDRRFPRSYPRRNHHPVP